MGCGASVIGPEQSSPTGSHRERASVPDKGQDPSSHGVVPHNNVLRVLALGGFSPEGVLRKRSTLNVVDAFASASSGPSDWSSNQSSARHSGSGTEAGSNADLAMIKRDTCVKVVAAVRPLLEHERGCKDIVHILPPGKIQLPQKPNGTGAEACYPFDFDRVLKVDNPSASREIFLLVLPVVERFCQGFNASVLAYGQTGSGKTYTMGTSCSESDFLALQPRGIVPCTLKVLFSYIGVAAEAAYDIKLKVQYVEIYNEQVLDLLSNLADQKSKKLDIRERANGEVFIDGAAEVFVSSRDEIARVLDMGNTRRSTAAHKMNAESSRSHAIMQLSLEQRAKPAMAKRIPKDIQYLRSKLHLVDLAGSERVKATGSSGDRLTEGVNINRGLLELGNVINALTQGKKRAHVPYRNSKLTRLLADSLGGNSETLFVACVSPADKNHDQTLNTLRYASRARAIRNVLILNNKLSPDEELEFLRDQVQKLQLEVGVLKTKLSRQGGQDIGPSKLSIAPLSIRSISSSRPAL